jgi:GTP-binding protein HflX
MENMTPAKAIIVGVCTGKEEFFNYEMKELVNLCEACNITCVESLTQNLNNTNNATYIGSGKLLELVELCKLIEVDYVIFNDELSPAELSNLADALPCEIMDRTMLILEIFKTRAKTKEAMLQVEIANLNYMLPRLVGARKNLSRIGGGGGGGAGARRGAGETKLELDRRYIENRISKLKQELQEVVLSRQTSRKSRSKNEIKTVAFVGYTNAGKSSTINSILNYINSDTDKQVFVKNMLFATLETSTRRIKLENNHEFLITDTVGFVNKLPHHLVESFKSTLEEITEASLIVHLIDTASPYVDWQIETTINVLDKLHCSNIPTVYAFNKVDLVTNEIFIPTNYAPSLRISNYTGQGIKELIEYIETSLFPDDIEVELLIPYTNGEVCNVLMEKANVLETNYTEHGTELKVILSKHLYELYKKYEKRT